MNFLAFANYPRGLAPPIHPSGSDAQVLAVSSYWDMWAYPGALGTMLFSGVYTSFSPESWQQDLGLGVFTLGGAGCMHW